MKTVVLAASPAVGLILIAVVIFRGAGPPRGFRANWQLHRW